MSDKYESREAVADKIAWEGGNWEALEYGIRAKDMPEGDTELAEAWQKLDEAYAATEAAWSTVEALLPESEGM